jgi:IS1 family transposase
LALFKKKKEKIWIFKAYDRHRKRLIHWEFGDRSHATFKKLFDRLRKWKILFYCGDHWSGFSKIIPNNRLFQGKSKTFSIEQNNGRQRHWFARFRRKTSANTRSLEMLEITMRIFAAIHVNKTLQINNAIFG